ncbi:fatty acid synthase [Nephila pilipes]|uniref:Fatty acid synthase n=1 Tax=Nephila pilipes TaxID=299642 RepID=A0A8X6T288_NEPPI|nr:fatty acid synthase [Nephila pilipes]
MNPKPRSARWISACYPPSEWDTPECKIINDDYFVHNLTSNVLFTSATKMIPSDAIIIEIAPHFLLRSLVKRTVGSKATYFGLMKRDEEESLQYFMNSLGE